VPSGLAPSGLLSLNLPARALHRGAICAAATWWLVDLAQSILVVPFMHAKTKLLIAAIALIVLLGMFLSALVAFSGRPTN
jgi:hypothetical protein